MQSHDALAERKTEVYRRAAGKKSRYTFGLIIGFVFAVVGVFVHEVVVFGGVLLIVISAMNLAASRYAEKQLKILDKREPQPTPSEDAKAPVPAETKDCPHCGKRIPASSRFCEMCGKRQPDT
jgi:hypothetical protein